MTPEMLEREALAVTRCALDNVEIRDSGAGDGQLTMRGHAAVFNRESLDLGGFKEIIAPGAFTSCLDGIPDVHLCWDHDTSLTLARTKNKTLELREDPYGLHTWARMAPTSYANDLAVLMRRGDVDQMSFRFTIDEEEWREDADGNITATVTKVGELMDVTVCARGAYPQTDASLARSRLTEALEHGRVEGRATETIAPHLAGGGQSVRLARMRAQAHVISSITPK